MSTPSQSPEAPAAELMNHVLFPAGLVGFPHFNHAELLFAEDELPFMRLRQVGADKLTFLVVRAEDVLPGYQPEIADEDVLALGINAPADVGLLIVATIHDAKPRRVTLNLVAPIAINRQTGRARQVVVENAVAYSARHVFFVEEA